MADFKWIDDCSDGIARHALQLLDEIFDEMTLGKQPILLSLYDPDIGIGREEESLKARTDILNMLVRLGVLERAEHYRVDNQWALREPREGFEIGAQDRVVRQGRTLLRARIEGRRQQVVPAQPAAKPKEPKPVYIEQVFWPESGKSQPPKAPELKPDAYAVDKAKTHAVERVKLGYTIVGSVVAAVIIAWLYGGWGWLKARFSGPTGPAATQSAPKPPVLAAADSTALPDATTRTDSTRAESARADTTHSRRR